MALGRIAGIVDIELPQGSDWSVGCVYKDKLTGQPIPITGMTIRAQVRKDFQSSAVILEITATIIDAINGQFTLSVPAATTQALQTFGCINAGQRVGNLGVYDIDLINGSSVTRIMEGKVTLSRSATQLA